MKNKVKLPIQSQDIKKIKADFSCSYPEEVKKFRRDVLRLSHREMARIMDITPMSYWNKEHSVRPFSAFESYVLETMREQYNELISKKP